jgi:hypothetical protein
MVKAQQKPCRVLLSVALEILTLEAAAVEPAARAEQAEQAMVQAIRARVRCGLSLLQQPLLALQDPLFALHLLALHLLALQDPLFALHLPLLLLAPHHLLPWLALSVRLRQWCEVLEELEGRQALQPCVVLPFLPRSRPQRC